MEPVATRGKWSGCENGKEGVDGSSPPEGYTRAPQIGSFCSRENLHDLQLAVRMERFMEPLGSGCALPAVARLVLSAARTRSAQHGS
jgi:hypothetical protein